MTFMEWSLPQLPTGSDIAALVNAGVITKDEARQILFEKGGKKPIEDKKFISQHTTAGTWKFDPDDMKVTTKIN